MNLLTRVVAAQTDLENEGGLEASNLLALAHWVGAHRNKMTPEMHALHTALLVANENLHEDSASVDAEVERMVRTLSALSFNLSLSGEDQKWLNEVLGDFGTLLAQCVRAA